jgi:WD40 repeat protein
MIARFDDHRGTVSTVAFSPNRALLATGSADATVKIWDVSEDNGRLLDSFGGLGAVIAVGFSPDSSRLFVATREGLRHLDVSLEGRAPQIALQGLVPRLPFQLNANDLLVSSGE